MNSIGSRGWKFWRFRRIIFGKQEPGTDEEIKSFCYTKYALKFPLFSKISVKGQDMHPLYHYLTTQSPFPGEIEWKLSEISGESRRRDHCPLSTRTETAFPANRPGH